MTNSQDPLRVFQSFLKAINQHDPDSLFSLMTEKHRFIDSVGAVFDGSQNMKESWRGYFSLFPDYYVECSESFVQGNLVIGFGTARGTFAIEGELIPGNDWQIPIAIRAMIEKDKVQEWRIYADNEPVRRIMERGLK